MEHATEHLTAQPKVAGRPNAPPARSSRRQLDRARQGALPLLILVLALCSVFVFGGDRGYFYRPFVHDWMSAADLALADNLFAKPFRFFGAHRTEDGSLAYRVYNRRPVGAFALINLATRPFQGDMSAQILVARLLMLGFFVAAGVLAYLSLARVTGDRWVATGATLLAFSGCYTLGYADAISSECSPVLFALMLVFHGMVRFADAEAESKKRFVQLLGRVCAALLLAWQVYGLLLAFVGVGLVVSAAGRLRSAPGKKQRERAAFRRFGPAPGWSTKWGRHAVLMVVALSFGGAVLGYNTLAERSAYDGHKAIADLPSVRSGLHRTGLVLRPERRITHEPLLSAAFYKWQFHRIGAMALPYALPGLPPLWITNLRDVERAHPRLVWVGVAVVGACLLGLLLGRRRLLLAVLVLSGFCWALPMRFETAPFPHDFEALSYIGIPLVFFALLLLGARRLGRAGPHLVTGLALGAALVFALSSQRMAELGWSAEAKEREQTLFAEFQAIRERARGRDVLIANPEAMRQVGMSHRKFWYYMAGSVLQYQDHSQAHGRAADFVLSLEHAQSPLLLTPSHRFVFLYKSLRALEEIAAARRRKYQRIAATEPVARSDWNVHLAHADAGPELAFVKTPCAADDAQARFLAHVLPVRVEDLAPTRRRLRFDNLDFHFLERGGARFDGKCLVAIPLPKYDIAALRVGRFNDGGAVAWQARIDTGRRAESLRRAARWASARRPLARADFDLHWEGKTLTYVRAPCAVAQTEALFFLHVTPVKRRDLPQQRRRMGFDNLDFVFEDVGARFDGRCVARVRLPDYDIAGVKTGQYDPAAGTLWTVDAKAPDADGKP